MNDNAMVQPSAQPNENDQDVDPTQGDLTQGDHPAAARTDTAMTWMLRGFLLSAMVVGAANALSYFVHSRGWGGILGKLDPHDEAIGFPLTVWRENGGYGSHQLQAWPFVANLVFATVIGVLAGNLAIMNRQTLNQLLGRFSGGATRAWSCRFTLRGLMYITVVCALAIAAVSNPDRRVLAAGYLLGPACLVAVAFIPRKIPWQQRVTILTPTTFLLIGVLIGIGQQLRIDFDKVLMGIFICWTPQAALAAIGLTGWLMAREWIRLQDLETQHHSGTPSRSQ